MVVQGRFRSFLGGDAFFFAAEDEEASAAEVFLNASALSWWPWKVKVAALVALVAGRDRCSASYKEERTWLSKAIDGDAKS
jgi:hypothetical protein